MAEVGLQSDLYLTGHFVFHAKMLPALCVGPYEREKIK